MAIHEANVVFYDTKRTLNATFRSVDYPDMATRSAYQWAKNVSVEGRPWSFKIELHEVQDMDSRSWT